MRRLKKSCKKGSLQDAIFLIVMLFAIALVLVVINHSQQKTMQTMNESGAFTGQGQEIITDSIDWFPKGLESLFTIIVFGLGIVAIILAFQVNSSPVFFVMFVVAFVLILVVAPVFSNVYERVTTNDADIYETSRGMPMTNFILDWYPKIMAVMSLLIAVVMFAKGGGGEG